MIILLRRFGIPVVGFLVGIGLNISGFKDIRVAVGLWVLAGLWAIIALLTWEPVRKAMSAARRIRIIITDPKPRGTGKRRSGDLGEKGILDHRLAVDEAIDNMTKTLNKVTVRTMKFGRTAQSYTNRFKKLQGSQDIKKIHGVFGKYAEGIEEYCKDLEKYIIDYKCGNNILRESFIPQIGEEEVAEARESAQSLYETMKGARKNIHYFRDSVLEQRGYSQKLNQMIQRLTTTLGALDNEMQQTERFCEEVMSIDKQIPS